MVNFSLRTWLFHVVVVLFGFFPALQVIEPVSGLSPSPLLTAGVMVGFLWLFTTSLLTYNAVEKAFILPAQVEAKHAMVIFGSFTLAVLCQGILTTQWPDVLPMFHASISLTIFFVANAIGLYLSGVRRRPTLA